MPSKGFFYQCAICNFNLDFTCAHSNGSKLNHICHPDHVLTYEKVLKRADKGVVCAVCLDEISGPLADYYSCRKCNFFLHKLCSERPLELTSSLHPRHPLLFSKDDNNDSDETLFCQECQKALHHHPLTFQARPAKFICDICSSAGGDGDKEDQSFSCSTCDFWIHKSCAYTTLTQRYKDHPHPLFLVQGVPEDLQIYGSFQCDICRNTISPEVLVSHCALCRYFVHLTCMITDDTDLIHYTKDAVDYLDDSFFKHLFMDDEFVVAHWPPMDICSELIQPFLLEKYGTVMDIHPKIQHFTHKQHDMILFQQLCVNNDNFFKEEDEEILCDGCIHPITAPYYCCQECNYYLHLACASLPSKINHSYHHHELTLTFSEKFYTGINCVRCTFICNGFTYECETCNLVLDLTCAALPAVIIHQTHEHPLFQMEANKDDGRCYACGESYKSDPNEFIFRCTSASCDVYLHYDCVMRSRSIRHRWDRQHPILLRYPPHGDHPEHFMCDMCEKLIHPMRWLYSCFQCDVSFHMDCDPRYQPASYHNMKCGGKLQIKSHPHILKYLRMATLKTKFDKCGDDFDSPAVFECETCYDCFCYKCVRTELLSY